MSHLKPAALELTVPQTAALSRAFCLKTAVTQFRVQPTLVRSESSRYHHDKELSACRELGVSSSEDEESNLQLCVVL